MYTTIYIIYICICILLYILYYYIYYTWGLANFTQYNIPLRALAMVRSWITGLCGRRSLDSRFISAIVRRQFYNLIMSSTQSRMGSSPRTWLAPPRGLSAILPWNYTFCSRSVYAYSFSNRQIIFMDIFKGVDNPFVLFQRDLVSGWHSLTLVQYCTCTCISQTALRSKIFLLL